MPHGPVSNVNHGRRRYSARRLRQTMEPNITSRRLAASDRLSHLEALELRVIQIQGLVLSCPTVRCPERLRFGPSIEHSTVLPDGVGGIERMLLRFGAFEKVKLYE